MKNLTKHTLPLSVKNPFDMHPEYDTCQLSRKSVLVFQKKGVFFEHFVSIDCPRKLLQLVGNLACAPARTNTLL